MATPVAPERPLTRQPGERRERDMSTTDNLLQKKSSRRDTTRSETPVKLDHTDSPAGSGMGGPVAALPIPAAIPHLGSSQMPSLRMRISERRLVLFVVDAFLLNLVLLLAAVLFADFPLTLDAILANSKWFITLTIVWYLCAQFFDCYSLPRASSMTASVKSVTMAVIATMLAYVLIPFLTPPLTSRGMIFYLVAFSAGSIIALAHRICQSLRPALVSTAGPHCRRGSGGPRAGDGHSRRAPRRFKSLSRHRLSNHRVYR